MMEDDEAHCKAMQALDMFLQSPKSLYIFSCCSLVCKHWREILLRTASLYGYDPEDTSFYYPSSVVKWLHKPSRDDDFYVFIPIPYWWDNDFTTLVNTGTAQDLEIMGGMDEHEIMHEILGSAVGTGRNWKKAWRFYFEKYEHGSVHALYFLAKTELNWGNNFLLAARIFAAIMRWLPEEDKILCPQALAFQAGKAFEAAGKYDTAIKFFEKAQAIDTMYSDKCTEHIKQCEDPCGIPTFSRHIPSTKTNS